MMQNHLYEPFIKAMSEIGEYGMDKYRENSFEAQAARGQVERLAPRQLSGEIGTHSKEHFDMYLRGELHDKFGTRGHQLAAVAFNAMMEFYFMTQEGAE